MLRRLGWIGAGVGVVVATASLAVAQMRVAPVDEEQGHVALGLALRRLANTGIFMHATAHPDDENNGLLVMLNRGEGYRTALATATRGNGGQNEIGPEIFEALGVLRTEELAAMHRFDGAEQYFTRAVDFGNSFSMEETFEKWGRDEIIEDFVHLIRMVRPDVILSLHPEGDGGGQHHQASAILARQAFRLAGDPTKYPGQLRNGLRPWQPAKFYHPMGFPGSGPPPGAAGNLLSLDLSVYDPLLGKTYDEIGTEARSMHKCQGMAQLLALPAPAVSTFQLVESTMPGQTGRREQSLFDGIDHSISGLARFAGAPASRELTDGLSAIASAVQAAQRAFDSQNDEATLRPLLDGLRAVRALRARLPNLAIVDDGRFEIDFRLRQKERELQQATLIANGVRVEALADDGIVVPGQGLRVSVVVGNRGAADVTVKHVRFEGLEGDAACALTAVIGGGGRGGGPGGPGGRGVRPPARAAAPPISVLKKAQAARCEPALAVPAATRPTEPYWHRAGEAGRYTIDDDAPFGLPYRPTPFYANVTLDLGGSGEEIVSRQPVQYRYEGNIFSGEKRSELLVVPAWSVRMSPAVAIVPASALSPAAPRPAGPGASEGQREIYVTVINGSKGPAEGEVHLDLPDRWTSMPARQPIVFSREDESRTVRFQIRAAPNASLGEYRVQATAVAEGRSFARGFQAIEYPHIRRQHIYHDAVTTLKVVDVRTAPNLTVGYVMGVGDEVPAALEQLGVKVEMIDEVDLAWGDLSRFDTIVTGVRAYERRADLRANNSRLLEYVRDGGTLIVQYNKFEFNQAQYGPYPAEVSSNRVTDEHAPVTLLAPDDPVFNTPNKIDDGAWRGWVQERGLYFLGERDPRYRDLVEIEDPFPNNPGKKRGALVAATYGKGRWIYVGLGLWRELPAGVDGAYQLLANLVSAR